MLSNCIKKLPDSNAFYKDAKWKIKKMINQHGNFHIFRTQSYNTGSWGLYKQLMKGKNLTQLSKVPLENHFFNEAINAQRKYIFEDLLGWMR